MIPFVLAPTVGADYGQDIDLSYDWPVPVDSTYGSELPVTMVDDGIEGRVPDNGQFQDLTETGDVKVGYGIERYFNPITFPLIGFDQLEPMAYSDQDYMETLSEKDPGWSTSVPMGPTDAVEQKLLSNYAG